MNFPHLRQKIFNEPWLILPEYYDAIRQTFLDHVGQPFQLDLSQRNLETMALFDAKPAAAAASGIAVIPVAGIIGKRLDMMETMCGGCDIDDMRAMFYEALESSSIKDIVFHYHTPGGVVTGAIELADEIYEAAQNSGKGIYSYTDTICASLGYKFASQSQFIAMAPSARIGSIGTTITFENRTKADEKAGVEYITLKSGKYKDLGNPHRAMESEEIEYMQAKIDTAAKEFWSVVERTRPDVDAQSLEAQVFNGKEALDLGLVDALYPTLESFLAAIQADN